MKLTLRLDIALGMALFALYVTTAGPSVVPYRDAGEMATAVPTLGVLHPTSYPLYSLTGYVFAKLPLANPAYRLNVFSGLAMAAAWTILLGILRQRFGLWPALITVLLGALSYHFWWHALVSEMYALHVLLVVALVWLWDRKAIVAFCFAAGLALANRADTLLVLPAFVITMLADTEWRKSIRRHEVILAALGFVVALSLYAYLPLRAAAAPWLNWNDPSTVERLTRTLFRLGYGRGLDLLSESYARGENFWPEFQLYARHLCSDYAYIGVIAATVGCLVGWKDRSLLALLGITGWVLSGPLFIYLGNLPPNAHAVAIMEAAYLTPDLFFLLLVAIGLGHGLRLLRAMFQHAAGAILVAIVLLQAAQVWGDVSKRHNFLAVDFARNVRVSMPPTALVVGRSDVPLFSLFYAHWIGQAGCGPIPVAQGLSGSAWYQTMMQRNHAVWVGSLKTIADWQQMAAANAQRPLYVTYDLDWPASGLEHFLPSGLASSWAGSDLLLRPAAVVKSRMLLSNFYALRGMKPYGAHRDFFSNELVEHYAKAWMSMGDSPGYWAAWSLKPDMPYAPFQLGFAAYRERHLADAEWLYGQTVRQFAAMETLAEQWKALPEVRAMIARDHAEALRHQRVVKSTMKT